MTLVGAVGQHAGHQVVLARPGVKVIVDGQIVTLLDAAGDGQYAVADQIGAVARSEEGVQLGVHVRADGGVVIEDFDVGIGLLELFDDPAPVVMLGRVGADALEGQFDGSLVGSGDGGAGERQHERQRKGDDLLHGLCFSLFGVRPRVAAHGLFEKASAFEREGFSERNGGGQRRCFLPSSSWRRIQSLPTNLSPCARSSS